MVTELLEQRVLKASIVVTVLLAAAGIVFGLISGSLAIIFDGMFNMIDSAMSLLSLWVTRLLTKKSNRKFQYGYWHVEPMVLAFNGSTLILLCVYSLVSAVGSLLAGGHELNFDSAFFFALLMSIVSIGMYVYIRHANSKLNSEFLRLDAHSWLISAAISSSLLVAFGFALVIEGTAYHDYNLYIDPIILAVMTSCLIFVPMPAVRDAILDMFRVAPFELDQTIRELLDALILREGYKTYTSYVAKIGRAQFIEINIVVPPNYRISSIESLDKIRKEINDAISANSKNLWLTVAFTADETST